ncbi:hypothetical protein TELCIR_24577, partial [Teladorsagia circumcincta]
MRQPKRKPVMPKPPPPPRPVLAPGGAIHYMLTNYVPFFALNCLIRRAKCILEHSPRTTFGILAGDVIKDQSLGLAWHNFLDRYTPSWTPAQPPPPPKPAMPPKQ